jgi:hypothetical protein
MREDCEQTSKQEMLKAICAVDLAIAMGLDFPGRLEQRNSHYGRLCRLYCLRENQNGKVCCAMEAEGDLLDLLECNLFQSFLGFIGLAGDGGGIVDGSRKEWSAGDQRLMGLKCKL